MRDRFEAIRRAELNRLQHKLSGLPPEAQVQVDHITRLIVEKLLLTPTEQLKAVSDDSLAATYSDALNRLFSLPPDTTYSYFDGRTDLVDDRTVLVGFFGSIFVTRSCRWTRAIRAAAIVGASCTPVALVPSGPSAT